MRHNRVKGGDTVLYLWCLILGPCSFYPPYYLIQASQLYWSGVPFPSPGDLPDPGVKPWSPALQEDSLLIESGKPFLPQKQ